MSSLALSSMDYEREAELLEEAQYYETCNDLTLTHGNNFSIALIGYPNSGKTHMFNQICGRDESVEDCIYTTLDPSVGHQRMKDDRLDWLVETLKPPNVKQQHTVYIDMPAVSGGAHIGNGLGDEPLSECRKVTSIALVLRAFEDDDLTHIDESVDPCRDLLALDQELKVHDINIIEEVIHIQEKNKIPSKEVAHMRDTAYKAWAWLNGVEEYGEPKPRARERNATRKKLNDGLQVFRHLSGKALRLARWSKREAEALTELGLLTAKPVICILNLSARDYNRKLDGFTEKVKECLVGLGGGPLVRYSCAFEERLIKLGMEPKKLKQYLNANPSHRSAKDDISETLQRSMNLIRFYEMGSLDECLKLNRAEHLQCIFCKTNLPVMEAAILVHPQFGQYFSFVQVATYGDLHMMKGDLADLKSEGKIRTQGTKYTIGDGDIVDFSLCTAKHREQYQKKRTGGR